LRPSIFGKLFASRARQIVRPARGASYEGRRWPNVSRAARGWRLRKRKETVHPDRVNSTLHVLQGDVRAALLAGLEDLDEGGMREPEASSSERVREKFTVVDEEANGPSQTAKTVVSA
jgi:hypothetical protein